MAVLGRLLVSSAERLDLPDLLSLDSYAAGDWKYFLKGIVGDTKPFILKGFDVIDPGNAIGTQSCSIRVADSVTFYPGSSAGAFFHGLEEGNPNAAPIVPELRKNAVNYVYLTFSTFNTSVDTRAFWDPDKDGGVGGEFTQDINTESVLQVQVNVSTGSFPANTIPVAKVTVGPVVITAIEDARDLMFRLGSGGISPNPFNTYAWRSLPGSTYARHEPPTQMLAGGVNPFQGADKNIETLKEWMDAVMSKLRELGGTTYWYDDTSSFSIITNFYDAVATAFKSKGKWVHDTVTPGLLTWTEDIQIKMTSDPRTYIIRQGSAQLADEQVMYIPMLRNQPINPTDESVSWINGQPFVNTIGGAVGLFANLSKGDYVKKANDTIGDWLRVEEFYDAVNLGGSTTTAAGARSIRLSSNYLGSTGAEKGRYDKGVYLPADLVISDRDDAAIANIGGNFHWLAIRSDTIENVGSVVTTDLSLAIDQHDGSTARVTSVAHGLVDGDRITITGTTNFDGTYQVEVETADIFYINISGGPFADESGAGHYALVTTAARSTPYGFQEESANHGFNTDDTIEIAGTTNYDGSYKISVRSATTFTIPTPGPAATETAGTATLARVIVRTEGAVATLIQGQVIDIGGSIADNIRLYVGMESLSQTAPNYTISSGYNTLDGMENYNSVINENLTARVAKLTAMMADKAQDKTIKILPSNGITSISNTVNGSAQELRFSPDGSSVTFVTPGSDGQTFVALPGSATPISLLENQAAYIEMDRNNASVVTWTVADIVNVPISENIFVLAVRMNTPDIYIWDGSIIVVGSTPPPSYIATIIEQNNNMKLVRGGNWSWGGGTTPVNFSAFYTGTNSAASPGNISNTSWGGQTFTASSTGNLTTVALYLSNQFSIATGTVVAKIYTSSGGLPGSLLGTSNTVTAASIASIFAPAGSGQTTTFTFGTPIALTNGTQYIVTIDATALTGGLLWFGTNSGTYPGGNAISTTNSGGTWTASAPYDLCFSIDGNISSANTLTWSSNAFVQIPGVAESANTIAAGSVTLTSDGDVAYVEVNRSNPGGTLTVSTAAIGAVPLDANTTIIARRLGTAVIVGNHSMLLQNGESKEMDAGLSIQNRALLGTGVTEATALANYSTRGAVNRTVSDSQGALDAIASMDAEFDKYFGQLRMIAKTAGTKTRVRVTGSDRIVFTGETITQEMGSLRMSFTGAEIDFATGNVYAGDATLPLSTDFTTALGINFTPATITANNYLWYSVSVNPSGTNADNTVNAQFNVIAGASSGTTPTIAAKPALGGTKKLGFVVVKDNGSAGSGTVLAFDNAGFNLPAASAQSKIAQLGVGSGSGSGTGLQKIRLFNPISTTLPTGTVTIDGVSVVAGDLVLFSNLGTGNNKIYKAVGSGATITGWQSQFLFNGSDSPSAADTVIAQEGTGFADATGVFTGTTWSFNNKVRYFNGADYWEVSSLNSAVLANNQAAPADIFAINWSGSENMIMDYSIIRGTAKELGTLLITTNGTTVELTTSNVEASGSPNILFSASLISSVIHVQYTSDNSGSAGQIKWTLKRWSDGAGGPGGIPSYSGGGGSSVTGGGSAQQIGIWSSPTNITGNANFTIDTSGNTLNLGSGANVLQHTTLAQASIASGPQVNSLLFTFSTAFNFAIVDYSTNDGAGNFRAGTLAITQDGVSIVNVVDTYSEIGTTGLTFASPLVSHTISGANVEIRYSSITGASTATFKYSMRRWN